MKNSTFLLLFISLAAGATLYLTNFWTGGGLGLGTGGLRFEHSYAEALKESRRTHKPIVLIFSASWCGPCKQMKSEVYPSSAVKPYHDKFVWAYLDTDETSNSQTAQQFKVRSIPHIEVINAAGNSFYQQTGGSSPEDFAASLESAYAAAK